jgi:hypothetical protein
MQGDIAAPALRRSKSKVELLGRADISLDQDTHAGETAAVVVAISG